MYETFWPWFREQVYPKNLDLPREELIRLYDENANKLVVGFRNDPPSILDPDNFTDSVPQWMQKKVRESLRIIETKGQN